MKIEDQTTSAVALVKEALEKAKKYEDYHIFVSLDEEGALKKAKEIDEKIKRGENPGRLAGVPYALKDNFLSPRGHTTASSKILEPPRGSDYCDRSQETRRRGCDYARPRKPR